MNGQGEGGDGSGRDQIGGWIECGERQLELGMVGLVWKPGPVETFQNL